MPRKPKSPLTRILTDDQIDHLSSQLESAFGSLMGTIRENSGLDPKKLYRFIPVAKNCESRRTSEGLTIKEAAAKLKVPQYRIKDIESSSITRIDPDILLRYVQFLGLESWFSDWVAANHELATEMGIGPIVGKGN